LYTLDSLKYAAVLKEKKQDSFPIRSRPFSTTHPKRIIKKDTLLDRNIRREFFTTHRAGMKLRTLSEIDKFYTEQKKQECHKEKKTAVAMAQVAQERVSITVNEYLNEKKYVAQKLIEKDNETLQGGLRQLRQNRFDYFEKVRKRRALFLEEKTQKAADRLLVQNLNNERTLLIKGMIKVDRLKQNEAVLKEKSLIVQKKLKAEKYQKNLLKQMKEFRAQETHKKHCEEKFVLNILALQKACERFQEAKAKVAKVKTNVNFKIKNLL
ncbi:PREDICTED: leucine-rich repeat and IQ domain-containing protein 3-like, partial [Galeopterus variegatus]|uniref:Leucine-rich repeat and IQ domain-containing protein 3-like n=2 Tax=Galeopterus variegatus TaxID=482537 RepID=A0ABM0RJU7_GALVR